MNSKDHLQIQQIQYPNMSALILEKNITPTQQNLQIEEIDIKVRKTLMKIKSHKFQSILDEFCKLLSRFLYQFNGQLSTVFFWKSLHIFLFDNHTKIILKLASNADISYFLIKYYRMFQYLSNKKTENYSLPNHKNAPILQFASCSKKPKQKIFISKLVPMQQ